MARGEVSKRASIIIAAMVLLVFGGGFVWMGYIRPALGHGEVNSVRSIDTSKGTMLLSSEDVGRGINRVVARRTSIIDPATLTRVARAFDSDADEYLGQSKDSGPLWFASRGKGSDPSRFVARDPLTLAIVVTTDDLMKKHPAELGIGIHEYKFDWTREAMWMLANDGHGYVISAGTWELTRGDAPVPRAPAPMPTTSDKIAPSLELLRPAFVTVRDDKNGKPIALVDPPGALVSSRASLVDNASVVLSRLDADGNARWKRLLNGQLKIIKVYLSGTRLLVISAGVRRDANDWLTALDANSGAVLGQYQF